MSRYIDEKVHGLPKPLRAGHKTSRTKSKNTNYLYKVTIHGITYYKVHLKRQNVSKIKYFKKMKDAEMFVEMLRINKYL